ncbi:prepilin peptidase [Bradyrhizobium sp. ERR14]|uniref:prepilin peptidase n=1 Tax=Bradyrhizobium sp. ERR14 TaxID=2663837 RepID=UPI00160FD619|nr:prepilin peptidase [Bradyrhizobium sp. ERR14]MBB4398900.1 prepilin signal peptidase PulO-like enzyme (type II secretory pathway) [Bradyrhizobium sp. ERR14]
MTNLTNTICYTLLLFACGWLIWTDLRHGIIPDWINGSIAALGLARTFAMEGALGPLIAGSQGLIIAALLLLLREFYFRWRSIQGLGLGDVKFLGAATLWTGLIDLPLLLLSASVAALSVVLCLHLVGQGITARTSIPFGPFLVVGLFVVLVVQASVESILF